jgi:hypothetical protein
MDGERSLGGVGLLEVELVVVVLVVEVSLADVLLILLPGLALASVAPFSK